MGTWWDWEDTTQPSLRSTAIAQVLINYLAECERRKDENTLKAGLIALASRLSGEINRDAVINQIDDKEVILSVQRWFSEAGNTQWLIIFDNYLRRSADSWDPEFYWLRYSSVFSTAVARIDPNYYTIIANSVRQTNSASQA